MTDPSKVQVPLAAALSLATGILVTDDNTNGFAAMHEATEAILQRPVWTHEFADKALADALKKHVLAAFENPVDCFRKPANCRPIDLKWMIPDYLEAERAKHGDFIEVDVLPPTTESGAFSRVLCDVVEANTND